MDTRLAYRFSITLLLCFSLAFSSSRSGIPDGSASLVFVFDTTGSMYDDLIQLRAGASKIISTTLERKEQPVYNFLLIPFHDPGTSRGFFSLQVNSLIEDSDLSTQVILNERYMLKLVIEAVVLA